MANPRSADFKMSGFDIQAALRFGRGRTWQEVSVDFYPSPDERFPRAFAFELHGYDGWNIWNIRSFTLFAKAGIGLVWFLRYAGVNPEQLLVLSIGAGAENRITPKWGLRLEGRVEYGAFSLTRTGHVMPSWFVVSLGLWKKF